MKFTSQLAVAALAATASAHAIDAPSKVERSVPNVVRQIATITGVLNQVGTGIDNLDSAVKAFSGNDAPVVSAANALVSAINAGTSTVSGSAQLSLTDALGLTTPVQALTAKGQQLTSDLLSKRPAIEAAGLCETTRSEITSINSASQSLIKATVSKVPAEAQSVAQSLAAGLTKVLNQAESDFSTSNCVDKSGSSSAPASSKAATSAPASSGMASSSAPMTSASGSVYVTSAVTSAVTSGYVAPTTTVVVSSTSVVNGTCTTGATSPAIVPTAGAAYLAPAGALAMAVAVALI